MPGRFVNVAHRATLRFLRNNPAPMAATSRDSPTQPIGAVQNG
ncbi:Uncharacterised protein [Amycolatopsis camponoti]|uniref:Uncharacterized protein n=1 Tax=Amycolatopsis camponoti TaxID=2606593 RepID=A0A6I8LFJ7_9PSEU|nr:Uncharacterised protein [Amycolatopsis camponoti]